jgi:hypothetical protein
MSAHSVEDYAGQMSIWRPPNSHLFLTRCVGPMIPVFQDDFDRRWKKPRSTRIPVNYEVPPEDGNCTD